MPFQKTDMTNSTKTEDVPVKVKLERAASNPPPQKVKSTNPWILHVQKWRKENPELVKTLKVTEIVKEARKTYTPVKK